MEDQRGGDEHATTLDRNFDVNALVRLSVKYRFRRACLRTRGGGYSEPCRLHAAIGGG